jgi:hypothetical protein
MKQRITCQVGGWLIEADVEENPLGHRFWTFAGFAEDPVEPRPYGGTRGVPLTMVEVEGRNYWLTAMEKDGSAQLWTPHELFQCADQEGAAEFVERWLAAQLVQPELF